MLDLTPLFNALITLLAALIAAFLIPWIAQKVGAGKREKLVFWVETAVKAAEEYFRGAGRGIEKLNYVKSFLRDKGFNLNADEIVALVNSTVWELINQFKKKQPVELPKGAEGTE